MTTDNPLSGHTDGTNDGLTDGSHILSPSLTNLYEGVHGNGILLPHDTAYGDSDRNDPTDLPGAISAGAAANQFVVKACDVILDGILYAIGGGSDITVTLTSTTTEKLGSFVALNSGEECLFVVVATADGLKVTQTVNITTAAGAYPSISGTAASYLTTGSGAGDNRQTVVLGTVRAVNAGGATTGDLNIESLSEYNDKRVFVRPSPLYFSPVRDGTISATTGINSHAALKTVHTGQPGTFGDNGIVWQSFNSAGESMLYYSAKDSSTRHTHLLGPTNIDVSSPSTNQTFTFDGDRVFVLTPSTTITLNPSGTFPPGHTVFVSVPSGSTVTFDSTGLNQVIAAGNALMFAYDGTNWKRVLFSSTVSTTASGASGVVQLSDGAGGFTSDSTLSYDTAANELTVDGKLTVTGLIDPTGLELTPQGSNPAAGNPSVVDANTLWIDTGAGRLQQGGDAVMRAGDDISELNNDSGFVDAAGAAAAAADTDLAYDAASRTVSSSTGTNAIITEVVSGGNSGLMTGAQATKLDGIEVSATADQTAAEIKTAYESNADTNAFTDAEKTKLSGIATGAEVNVNADWNAVSGDAQILNKPSDITDLSTHSVTELSDVSNAGSGAIITSAERTKLGGIETAATADQDADEVPVAATPSNYTAATADVEAHLSGIDTALGAVAVVETDPVFSASEAALLAPGDAVKLAGIETGAQVNIPLQHMRLYGINTGADLHTVTAGARVYLDLGDVTKFTESTTGLHPDIMVMSGATDYITINAGGIYQITAHIGVFPISSGAIDQDVWIEFSTNTSPNRELGVIRDRSVSAFHNRNLKMSTVVEVPSTDPPMNIYISVLNSIGSTIGLRAYDNNRFFFTVTRIGDATV